MPLALRSVMILYLFAEVIFFSGQRKHLPANGYRPDAIFDKFDDYWGITFVDLPIEKFDDPTSATIIFTFEEWYYQEVIPGQSFTIMEGPHQVGEGRIISMQNQK